MKESEEIKMDNCSDYETKLDILELYNYYLAGCLYIYDKIVANKRVKHLMKHGRTERIRKKNQKRYYSERRLFVKRGMKK